MPSHRGAFLTVSLFLALTLGESAWATIDNFKSYKLAYPGKEPKAYSCKVCHENPIGKAGDLNVYGNALKQFKTQVDAKKLTEEDFRAFEAADADGDGATNLQELDAGTDLNDPASVPEGFTPANTTEGAPSSDASGAGTPAEEPSQQPAGGLGGHPTDNHEHLDQSSRDPRAIERLHASLDQWMTPVAWAGATADTSSEAAKAPAESPQAEYVGLETCVMCHAKQAEEFKHSTHARISISDEEVKAQGCEMCHGPGSLHVDAGGGQGVGIINPRKDPSTCFNCHLDKKAEFRLPYHHPLLEGKMSCADCHNAHGEDVRPWSATSLNDINEACFKCHKEQRGPFVWEHEALREGCTTCHKVHGSINDKMLLARDSNLCLRCHTQTNFPTIGKVSHATSRIPVGTCFSAGCHTAVHGSNFDDHLRY